MANQELRSLMITANFNADGVTRAANTIEVATAGMSRSYGVAGTALGKMQRAFDDGAGGFQKIERWINQTNSAWALGKVSTDNFAASIVAMTQKTGVSLNPLNLLQAELVGAAEAATIAAKELAKLNNVEIDIGSLLGARSEYDKLFAAQLRAAEAIRKINQQEREGAISARLANSARAEASAALKSEIIALNEAARATEKLNQRRRESAASIVASKTIRPDRGSDIAAAFAAKDADEQIRASVNPRFGLITQYTKQITEWRQQQAAGKFSAEELTEAINRQRTATLAAISALKGARTSDQNDSLRASYDAVFAAQLRYKKELENIDLLEKNVANSTAIASQARVRAAQTLNQEIAAIQNRNAVQAQTLTSAQERIQSAAGRRVGETPFGNFTPEEKLNVRASIDPRAKLLLEYTKQKQFYTAAEREGIITADAATEAIKRQRQATVDHIESIKTGVSVYEIQRRRNLVSGIDPSRANRQQNFNSANIAAQFHDIFITAQGGMSIGQIALQQGTQISAVLEGMKNTGASVGSTLKAAFLSVVSPLSLITIGAVAAGAALIKWGFSGKDSAEKLTDTLKKFRDAQKEVAQGYIDRANAQTKADSDSQNILTFRSREAAQAVEDRLKDPDTIRGLKSRSTPFFSDLRDNAALVKAVRELRDEAKGGVPDFDKYRQALLDIANDGSFVKATRERAKALIEESKELRDAQLSLEKYRTETSKGFQIRGEESSMSALEDMRRRERVQLGRETAAFKASMMESTAVTPTEKAAAARASSLAGSVGDDPYLRNAKAGLAERKALFEAERSLNNQLSQMRASFDADMSGIGAKSPQEKASLARAQALAQADPLEDKHLTNLRAEIAYTKTLTEATYALSEAQQERVRNLNETVAQQQFELGLIGKTSVEAAGLRFEFEKINALKSDALRNGGLIDPAEVDVIRQAAAEMQRLAEAAAKANLYNDLKFELDQLGRSPQDQAIASRLQGAGLRVDLNSPEAQMIRQIEQVKDLKSGISDFASDIRSSFLENGGDLGDAFGNAVRNAAMKQLDKLAEVGIEMLSRGLSGLFGLGGGSGQSGFGSSLAGGSAALFSLPEFRAGANDNYSKGAVQRAAIPPISARDVASNIVDLSTRTRFPSAGQTKTGIPLSKIGIQGLNAKVASPYADRFQGLLSDLDKQGYKIRSLGEGGYSYRKVAGSKNLSRHSFGESIDINPNENPHSYVKRTDMPSNINELARKNGLRWGGNWRKPDTMHFDVDKSVKMPSMPKIDVSSETTGSISAAAQASADFTKTTTAASKSVSGFDSGINSAAKSLSSVGQAASGGGASMGGGGGGGVGGMGGFGGMFAGLAMGLLSFGLMSLFKKKESKEVKYDTSSPRSYGAYSSSYPSRNPVSGSRSAGPSGVHLTVGFAKTNGGIEPLIQNVVQSTAPDIAKREASNAVGRYDEVQTRGGLQQKQHAYSRFKR
jgi:hypothetical protein